jgi:hypothetical protein
MAENMKKSKRKAVKLDGWLIENLVTVIIG